MALEESPHVLLASAAFVSGHADADKSDFIDGLVRLSHCLGIESLCVLRATHHSFRLVGE